MTGRSIHAIVKERQEHRLEHRFMKAEDSKGPWVPEAAGVVKQPEV